MTELELTSVEVTTEEPIKIDGADSTLIAEVQNLDDLVITAAKKEYTVVGDGIYIPQLYDDAPQWMKDLVQVVVNVAVDTNNISLVNQLNEVLSQFANSYVPLNQYTQSILDLSDEDTRLNTVIETLNSNYNDGISNANAQIIDLQTTKASKDEVVATVLNTISAQLNDANSSIGASLATLQQAIVDESSARVTSTDSLIASLGDVDDNVQANAAATSTLNSYVGLLDNGTPNGTGLLADVEILQKQNDGVIETVTGTYDVILNALTGSEDDDELVVTAEPYASWLAEDIANSNIDTRLAHIGDVYIKYQTTTNGAKEYVASYKFIKTAVDGTSPYATDTDGFTWAIIIDQAAQDAYTEALNAYDLADNKRRVFVETPSGPYDIGDLWVDSSNTYKVIKQSTATRALGYSSGDWVIADEQNKDFVENTYEPTISTLQNQVDGKIEYYFDDTLSPNTTAILNTVKLSFTAADNGSVYYFTETEQGYWYSSTTDSWIAITDVSIYKALKTATQAQAYAEAVEDGVIVSYYAVKQGTAPTTNKLWFKSDNFLYQYVDSAWTKIGKAGDTVTVVELDTNGDIIDSYVYVYNGTTWYTETEGGIVASSSAITDLKNYVEMNGHTAGGNTTLLQDLNTEIANGNTKVDSKFAYNSELFIDGIPYYTGFGLTSEFIRNADGTGSKDSEFWVDANKIVFRNSNSPTNYQPFSYDGNLDEFTFNGKVTFGSVTGVPSFGSNNLLENSAPALGSETYGWEKGWYNTNIAPFDVAAGFDPWRPTSAGSVYITVPGSPTVGTVFDIRQSKTIPVVAGKRYEISALISSHRCTSICTLAFFNSAGTYISEMGAGSANSVAYSGDLSNWVRQGGFVYPPAGASYAQFYIRSTVAGVDPYCFVSQAYMGEAVEEQTELSFWSEGVADSKDELARKLGYLSYADMETKAIPGQTIINDGSINTQLIAANSITTNQMLITGDTVAALNVVGGIVASSIYANTLEGYTIKGAYIEGSTIKASYLDLDGDLEILTSWSGITDSIYQANPSLYPDLAYDTGTGNWRAPTLSVVRESNQNLSLVGGGSLTSSVYSYNSYNVGHNKKARLEVPGLQADDYNIFTVVKEGLSDYPGYAPNNWSYTDTVRLYVGNVYKTFKFGYVTYYQGDEYGDYYILKLRVYIDGVLVLNDTGWRNYNTNSNHYFTTFTIGGVPFIFRISYSSTYQFTDTNIYSPTYGSTLTGYKGLAMYIENNMTAKTDIVSFSTSNIPLFKVENLNDKSLYVGSSMYSSNAYMSNKFYFNNLL